MSDENATPADENANTPAAEAIHPEPDSAETPPPLPLQALDETTDAESPPSDPDAPAEFPADLPPVETPGETATEPEAETATEAEPEIEAPKPKRARKSKASTTGADGPSDAPASTDPNAPAATDPGGDSKKKWYVVKIQSGREDSIKAAIERKVKIEGLESFFGQIAIPVEEIVVKKSVKVKDKKTGDKVTQEKKVIKHTKKYPGYLFAEVEFNDRILYLFRETSGVGDFVGAGLKREPTPMTDREVTQMLTGVVGPGDQPGGKKGKQVVKLDFEKGDKVKIRDGPFANMEGEVKAITEAKETGETPKVTVEVTIFGRGVPVELDYWHVDKV